MNHHGHVAGEIESGSHAVLSREDVRFFREVLTKNPRVARAFSAFLERKAKAIEENDVAAVREILQEERAIFESFMQKSKDV